MLAAARTSSTRFPAGTSKKIRAAFRSRGMSGQRISTTVSYGYIRGEDGNLAIDKETVPVVEMIFQLCAEGNGPSKIARILTEREIKTPGAVRFERTGQTYLYHPDASYSWLSDTVANILDHDAYLGRTTKWRCKPQSGKGRNASSKSRSAGSASLTPLFKSSLRATTSECSRMNALKKNVGRV